MSFEFQQKFEERQKSKFRRSHIYFRYSKFGTKIWLTPKINRTFFQIEKKDRGPIFHYNQKLRKHNEKIV